MTEIINVTCKETGETICIKANRFNPEFHEDLKAPKTKKKAKEVVLEPISKSTKDES